MQELRGAARHRTVEVQRHVGQPAGLAQQPQVVDQGLRPADREGRNHHSATALHGAFDHASECLCGKHTGQHDLLARTFAEDHQT